MLKMTHYNAIGFKLINIIKALVMLTIVCLMPACAVTPSTVVQTPTTAKPVAHKQPAPTRGAIYTASAHKPLFEDRRARAIGDIITINITENTSANKAGSSSNTKSGSINSSASIPTGLPVDIIKEGISITADSDLSADDTANETESNTFTGNITVTVTDVLPNGNLMVSGEKQVALDKGTEFVRFSGVVNPDFIRLGNVVSSTTIADARIEYRTNSKLDTAQVASILARFFLSFSPI